MTELSTIYVYPGGFQSISFTKISIDYQKSDLERVLINVDIKFLDSSLFVKILKGRPDKDP